MTNTLRIEVGAKFVTTWCPEPCEIEYVSERDGIVFFRTPNGGGVPATRKEFETRVAHGVYFAPPIKRRKRRVRK